VSGSYHDNEALLRETRDLADRAGARAVTWAPGRTVEGREIVAVRVAAPGGRPADDRPQVLLVANIHGNEVIGSEVALEVLDRLTAEEPDSLATAVLGQADVTVVPAVNLDAREPAARALSSGHLWARAPRGNRHGVDLNRNFPYPEGTQDVWHPLSGTSVRWLPWYRGPSALSEPEAQAVAELAATLRPRAAVNLHSVGRLFLYPWCHTAAPPSDLLAFEAMGSAFVTSQSGPAYRTKQARAWYTILGDLDDWLYDTYGTLSVTVELSRPLAGVGRDPRRLLCPLAWMNPRTPESTCANTAGACLAALSEGARQVLRSLPAADDSPGDAPL